MPNLHTELHFAGSKKPKITIEIPPAPDSPDKLTLGLRAMLTPQIATELGCEWAYVPGSTVAQENLKQSALEGILTDVELRLKGSDDTIIDTIYPESISAFSIFKVGGGQLGISMTVSTAGNFDPLLDFFRRNRSEGFEFFVRSRQGELFEGGTRVEVSEETDVDRSYETRPRGGRRNNKQKALLEAPAAHQIEPPAEDPEEMSQAEFIAAIAEREGLLKI